MNDLDSRRHQMFPTLSPADIDRLRRFGECRSYAAGEALFEAGKPAPGMFVVISGIVDVSRRDPLGHLAPIVKHHAGEFTAEVSVLSGGITLVDAHACGPVEAMLIPSDRLHTMLMAETELGDRIMRAFVLRRVALIESGLAGPVLIGPPGTPDMVRLQGFLTRNGYPHQVLDPAEDKEAAEIVARYAPDPAELPLAACTNGEVLKNPTESALARCLGMVRTDRPDRVYDVAIVGAGPAGLATAVYAASEGLSVILLDARAYGGQAGASARIENYFGFATGISGHALTSRAFLQAQKFGAETVIPATVTALDCDSDPFALRLDDDRSVRARTVVVASGARYRRPAIVHREDFEGRGVWYWCSPVEARMCKDSEVVLVGGGNSAGQAAVYVSGFASKVWMMVRGAGLADSMSRYLIERIGMTPNIELLTQTEIVGLSGSPDRRLEHVRWRNRATGAETARPIRNVFLFVGADPATDWLKDCGVSLDGRGFVPTGTNLNHDYRCAHVANGRPLPLESSVPGVFAVGDVRAGSVKRVGGAIGEGAAVVAQIHSVLAGG